MSETKSKFQEIIDALKAQGKVITMSIKDSDAVINKVETDLEKYRVENQKRILESQEAIKGVVLNG